MGADRVTVTLSAKVNRPLTYGALLLRLASEWLLSRAVKVNTRGS